MRKSKKEAAQTREAIVDAAADHIGQTGIAGASLADMMAAAGLTHGGFYRHFRNKEHLVAEALSAAGCKITATIRRKMAMGGLDAVIDSYLSISHRNSPTPICLFAALGSEVARSDDETKVAATEVLERLLVTLADDAPESDARGDAIVGLSTMIGAMILARIASDPAVSAEILKRARDHLHRQAGPRRYPKHA